MNFKGYYIDTATYASKFIKKSKAHRNFDKLELWVAFIDGNWFSRNGKTVAYSKEELIKRLKKCPWMDYTVNNIFYHELIDDEYRKLFLEKFPKKAKDISYVKGLSSSMDILMEGIQDEIINDLCNKGIIELKRLY